MPEENGRLEAIRPTLRELGRDWAARRRQVEHQCEVCGKTFTGLMTARYCSGACRVRAYRERQQGKDKAAA